ncbi:adenylyltransferase and sulfurtransferase [Nematocida ausubeli]|nr:adenylyltransferase and sulfurtransferase [Nematocida ausubeli]
MKFAKSTQSQKDKLADTTDSQTFVIHSEIKPDHKKIFGPSYKQECAENGLSTLKNKAGQETENRPVYNSSPVKAVEENTENEKKIQIDSKTSQNMHSTKLSSALEKEHTEENPLPLSYIDRYSRQMVIKEIGVEGQRKIKTSRVLVVGAGGLGAPALMYLAAMGVQKIGISDFDVVEESNLNRQVLYRESSIGKYKAKEAVQSLTGLCSSSEYTSHPKITSENVWDICSSYDLVMDCGDNRSLRYLLSDCCKLRGIPYICGSSLRWEGHVYTFNRLCYRCVHPVIGTYASGSCSSAGIIGSMCGVVGSLMATEAMKAIIGIGASDSLVYINGLKNEFMNLSLNKKLCTLCKEAPHLTRMQRIERIAKENQILEEKEKELNTCLISDLVEKMQDIDISKIQESAKNSKLPFSDSSAESIGMTPDTTPADKKENKDQELLSDNPTDKNEGKCLTSLEDEVCWSVIFSSPEKYFIVDTRSSAEHKIFSIPNSYLYPLSSIVDNPKKARDCVHRKAAGRKVVLCCRNGSTSRRFVFIFGALSAVGGIQEYIKQAQEIGSRATSCKK